MPYVDWALNGLQSAKPPPARDKDGQRQESSGVDSGGWGFHPSVPHGPDSGIRGDHYSGGSYISYPVAADPAGLTRHVQHDWRTWHMPTDSAPIIHS